MIKLFKNNVLPREEDPYYEHYKSKKESLKSTKLALFGSLRRIINKASSSEIDRKILKSLVFKVEIPNLLIKE